MSYLYLSLIFGDVLLLSKFWKTAPSYYKQVVVILIGSLAPLVGGTFYMRGKSPRGLDLSPFIFIFTGLFYAFGLFHYRLFDLAPVARHKVFESMYDGVLVLDAQDRIVDYNPSFQQIVPEFLPQVVGRDAAEILQNYPELLGQITAGVYEYNEMKTGTGESEGHS